MVGVGRREHCRLSVLLAIAMSLVFFQFPLAKASAEVDGNRFTSRQFGFSIEWSETWRVETVEEVGEYDYFRLRSTIATFDLLAYWTSDTTAECLADQETLMAQEEWVVNLKAERKDGKKVGGTSEERAWGNYTMVTVNQGVQYTAKVRMECRKLEPSGAMIELFLFASPENFATARIHFETMVATLQTEQNQSEDSGSEDQSTSEPTSTASGSEPRVDTLGMSLSASEQELVQYISSALVDVEDYWSMAVKELVPNVTYQGIEVLYVYDSRRSVYPSGYGEEVAYNAFFNPETRTMAYDLALVEQQIEVLGSVDSDSLIALAIVVAHEVGHNVQLAAKWPICLTTPCLNRSEMTGLEVELQADCFSGAWAADAEARERLGRDDLFYSVVWQLLSGMPGDQHASWGAHGSPALRAHWFLSGYTGGPAECLEVSSATDPTPEESAMLLLPAA